MSDFLMMDPTNVGPPDIIWNDVFSGGYAVAFSIGSMSVSWYSIFILMGFALAIFLSCMKLWKWYKVPVDPFYWFILIGVPVAIFGANFWSCVLGPDNGGKEWSQFWTDFGTGLAIEGGVMFTVLAAFIYFPLILRRAKYQVRDLGSGEPQVRKISIWVYADAIVPTILIAQFLGRWGNYMNQEVYGAVVTNEALALWLHDHLPWMWLDSQQCWVQPLFLYEGIANMFMFLVLFFAAEFIPKKKAGDLSLCYFIWYGALRMALEPLRNPDFRDDGFGVTMITSLMFVIVGIILIILNHTALKKAQKFNIWLTIKSYLIYWWNNVDYKINKKNYESKTISISKKIKEEEKRREELQKQLHENNKKLDQKNEWYKKVSDDFIEKKKQFKRSDAQMLFYFGRY